MHSIYKQAQRTVLLDTFLSVPIIRHARTRCPRCKLCQPVQCQPGSLNRIKISRSDDWWISSTNICLRRHLRCYTLQQNYRTCFLTCAGVGAIFADFRYGKGNINFLVKCGKIVYEFTPEIFIDSK